MNKLAISILEHTPEPELIIATAGKLCYSKGYPHQIKAKLTDEEVKKYINKLMSSGHMSPLEHASVTFSLCGVSRTLTHQLVRHRVASYSQQSQRYVSNVDNFRVVEPFDIRKDEKCHALFQSAVNTSYMYYVEIVKTLTKKYMKEENLKESLAEKKAIELARYVLPEGTCTKMVFTMNFRECLHFLELRHCKRAHPEIQAMATMMRGLLIELAPNVFEKSGAPCVRGACREGSLSCGNPFTKGES